MTIVKKWIVLPTIPDDIKQELDAYQTGFRQLLYNRGILRAEDADLFVKAEGPLYDPFLLKGMDKAVERIMTAIKDRENIIVYGDYDVDGVTATALLVQALTALGGIVLPHIPDRFEEGYGLTVQTLQSLADSGAGLVITADCGIRSIREVDQANQMGLEMIISDHHQPGPVLPAAIAVINPKLEDSQYPERNLAGVGVAFKIAEALAASIDNPRIHVHEYLDLVAMGTVADIVPLTGENRAMVKAGIRRLRTGTHIGLRALSGAAGINIQKVSSRDIGFMLGPRLNAAGRLDSARKAYDLLVASDPDQAGKIAQQLDDLNRTRQGMVTQMVEIALAEEKVTEPGNIVLSFNPAYEQGVVGLVASRIAERHYRPAIIGQIKGDLTVASCRSIPDFHITNALDQVAELFEKHGGHDMAAGFTIQTTRIEDLKNRLNEIANGLLAGKDICPILCADMEIYLKQLPPNILERIEEIEPTGQANPEVLFLSNNVKIANKRTVGDGQHLSLVLKDGQKTFPAIAFRKGELINQLGEFVDIVYAVTRNEYNGNVTTQLHVVDIRPAVLEPPAAPDKSSASQQSDI